MAPAVPGDRSRTGAWLVAAASSGGALAYGLFVALRTYEIDLGVYLRLGGRYVFTPHLYSTGLPNTTLLFTYPPFAALLFAPWRDLFGSVATAQTAWTMCNLGALLGIVVVSLRAARPELRRSVAWRWALALSLPVLLLNPVLVTIGFGQVNLVVTLLVLWDLLTPRRLGRRQVPLGLATGLAAAVKLTPLLFVPYLLLTRRVRGALVCTATFGTCEAVTFLLSPASSAFYWTRAVFTPGRAGDLFNIRNQNLTAVLDRVTHGIVPNAVTWPVLLTVATAGLLVAAIAHRRSSPMLGVLVCAATGLLVSPVSWAHHMVWVVPALVWLALAEDRPKWGRAMAVASAVLFWSAPIWWVPSRGTSDLHLDAWQLVAGDSFALAMLVFLAGSSLLLFKRRSGLRAAA